jgi:hypothetical protein
MPPSMWWIKDQENKKRSARPGMLAKKLETTAYWPGPAAMATSHQASRRKPTALPTPVMRWAIDINIVSIGR